MRSADNMCTDLYILLKPQSELDYLGLNLCIENIVCFNK